MFFNRNRRKDQHIELPPAILPAAPVAAPIPGEVQVAPLGDRLGFRRRTSLSGYAPAVESPAPHPLPIPPTSKPSVVEAPSVASLDKSPLSSSSKPGIALDHAKQVGALEALYSLVPELRALPPEAMIRKYADVRREAGRIWSVIAEDLGMNDDIPKHEKAKLGRLAEDHPLHERYKHARAVRDASVLAIASDKKRYIPLLGESPHVKIAFDADLGVAMGVKGVRETERQEKMKMAARFGAAGPMIAPRPLDPHDRDRLEERYGRIADVREISNNGIVGTITRDRGGPFDIIAYGRAASELRHAPKNTMVKVMGKPTDDGQNRFRVNLAFPRKERIGEKSFER